MATHTKTPAIAAVETKAQSAIARAGFLAVERDLNASFPERSTFVRLLLACFIARQHILMLGEPGVAKSALAEAFCNAIGSRFFEYLLTRFTEPMEIFGPTDIKIMADTGRIKMLTAGRATDAEVVFLDEIFKSNSALLNSLLKLINERKYFDDGRWVRAPLECIVAASNEVPDEGEKAVEALYDRILARVIVRPLDGDAEWEAMVTDALPRPTLCLSTTDIAVARAEADQLRADKATLVSMRKISRDLRAAGIIVSDRRWKASLTLMRAMAWLDGAASVSHSYVSALDHVAWSQVKHIPDVEAIIKKNAPQWDVEMRAIREVINQQHAVIAGLPGLTNNEQRSAAVGAITDVIDGPDGTSGLRADVEHLRSKHPEAVDGCDLLVKAIDDLEAKATNANIRARAAGRKQ